MDFSYSEEQLAVKNLAEKILGDQTDNEHLKLIDAREDRFDDKLWQDLAAAGLLGVALDEQYGGMGFGFETLCLLVEEVGRTVAPAPVIPVLVSAASTLQKFADSSICEHYLPAVASGQSLITAAMLEPGNEDFAHPTSRASEQAGSWRITGRKQCVPFAHRASAILLSAQTEQGTAVFLLTMEAEGACAQGVSLNRQQVTAGEPQFELLLEQAEVTLLAEGGRAEDMLKWWFESTAAAYAAMATGLCERMLRMTASYTSERQQFGVAIATFQAVGHQAADCFIDIECLRLTTQQAISLLDGGLDAREAVLIAKIWTGDVTHRVSQAAQQLHGGIGVDRDYPLWRYCLWARQIELSCGSSAALLATLGEDIAAQFAA
jgi:alkylation response protein AidB-like acyl-CoA dehydrogenase